jgi:hypothetical protein
MHVRDMLAHHRSRLTTYGTVGDSLNLMKEAWRDIRHVFSVRDPSLLQGAESTQGECHVPGPRYSLNLLGRHLVDLLVVECGNWQCTHPLRNGQRWEQLVAATSPDLRPQLIIEVWPPNSLLWDLGPAGRAAWVRWERLGFQSKMKVIDSQHCGEAFVQPRALVIRDRTDRWVWAPYQVIGPLRPMQNLLIPKGL